MRRILGVLSIATVGSAVGIYFYDQHLRQTAERPAYSVVRSHRLALLEGNKLSLLENDPSHPPEGAAKSQVSALFELEIRKYAPHTTAEIAVQAPDYLLGAQAGRHILEPYLDGFNTRSKPVKYLEPMSIQIASYLDIKDKFVRDYEGKGTRLKPYLAICPLSSYYATSRVGKPNNPYIKIREYNVVTYYATAPYARATPCGIAFRWVTSFLIVLSRQSRWTKSRMLMPAFDLPQSSLATKSCQGHHSFHRRLLRWRATCQRTTPSSRTGITRFLLSSRRPDPVRQRLPLSEIADQSHYSIDWLHYGTRVIYTHLSHSPLP